MTSKDKNRQEFISGKEIIDSKLQKPFRLLVGGGSGTGKSTFVQQLVNESHFESPFDKIVYCYPEYLDEPPAQFEQIVENKPGLCDLHYFTSLPQNSLIIYDDLMSECGRSDEIMKLFSVIARKRNISVIFLVQNIYDNSKQFRNIRLNATGLVMFNFYAAKDVNKRIIRDFGVQSNVPKHLMGQVYNQPFSYLYIDIHPQRKSNFASVKGNIFDENFSVYNKMEYIAIPKSEFIKHFKIVEAKEGSIRAVKDVIKIKKNKRKRKRKYSSDEFETATESDQST